MLRDTTGKEWKLKEVKRKLAGRTIAIFAEKNAPTWLVLESYCLNGAPWRQSVRARGRPGVAMQRGMNAPPAHPWPLLALLLALPACSGFESTPLADFRQPELRFQAPLHTGGSGFEVTLEFTLPPDADCPVVPAATRAWLNGHALEVTYRGGRRFNLVLPDGCGRPTFTATGPIRELGLEQEVSTFEVEDGHTRWVFEALHAVTERRLVLAQPQDGVLRPGAEVRVELSVPTDVGLPQEAQAQGVAAAMFFPTSGPPSQGWSLTWDAVTLEGSALRFTVPASAPAATGILYVDIPASVGARRCEGPTACRGLTHYSLELPVSVSR
jgi:hypothetical protein